MKKAHFFVLGILFLAGPTLAQQQDSTLLAVTNLRDKWISRVGSESTKMQKKLDHQSSKYLNRFLKEEQKAIYLLSKVDSFSAQQLIASSQTKLQTLSEKILHPGKFTQFIPGWDSLSTSLKFLNRDPTLLVQSPEIGQKISESLGKINGLESELQKAEVIRQFMAERRQLIGNALERVGMVSQIKSLNKEVFYYSQQLREYKQVLNDPDKVERKAMELLSKSKIYQDFMKKNSMLASLFRIAPDDPNEPSYLASLAGLQTRADVNQIIQGRVNAAGPEGMQTLQSGLNQAQSQLQALKNKVSKLGAGASDLEMPQGFKPNEQRTKTFLQRLEYSTNIQTQRSTYVHPVISDLGISIGYKLNDKSVIGIGASYKMGWGQNFQHIRISNEGVGLRSFVDWKIKGGLWISGGYEMNYLSSFAGFSQLKVIDAWQQSGLLGLTKKLGIKSKLFKNTKLQLLWDFLSSQHVPRTEPILFRVGYTF